MIYRRAVLSDVPAMVAVHVRAFEGFFLTSLGPRFLRRFYRSLVASEEAVAIVAANGGVAGFAAGPINPTAFFRKLLVRQGIWFAIDAVPAVLADPMLVVGRLARAVRYRGESREGAMNEVLLSSVAVDPASQGRGIAARLVSEFCGQSRVRGCQSVYLLTDAHGNDKVRHLYTRCGFQVEREICRPDGRKMVLLVRSLPDAKDSANALA